MTRLNKTMLADITAYANYHTVKETADRFAVPYANMMAYITRHKIKHAPRKTTGKDNNNYKTGFAMNKKLYWVYYAMLQRCYHKNCKQYHRYGGRGITVCQEWKDDSTAFYRWAIQSGYREGLTLDRVDNDKGYSPDNCAWVTNRINVNHTSKTHFITYNGKTQSMKQWADELGINYSTLRNRLNRSKMTVKEAFINKE